MKKDYFILFACCISVKGFKRSTICDVQRNAFKFIPNELHDILLDSRKKTIDSIKSSLRESDQQTIDEYLQFLEDNEFGFWTDSPELFPEIELAFHSPSLITNSVIDFKNDTRHPMEAVINQLDFLGCKDVQLRFFEDSDPAYMTDILNHFNGKRIKSVEIIVKYMPENFEYHINLPRSYNRITNVIIHSAVENRNISKGSQGMGQVFTVQQIIDSESHCGIISPLHFSINLETVIEAVNFNSCLNRKISIDKNGYIKNCPSMQTTFGHVNNTSLVDVVHNKEFSKMGLINKDVISECQDCEFRYICTDCRAYTKNPSDQLSKPVKCNYNPYENTWCDL